MTAACITPPVGVALPITLEYDNACATFDFRLPISASNVLGLVDVGYWVQVQPQAKLTIRRYTKA